MIPPPIPGKNNRWLRTLCVSAAIVVLAAAGYYYYSHDPGSAAGAPKCTFKLLTGWDCPGCGSQRALHALLHGQIGAAWHFNPFVFFAIPAAIFYAVVESGRARWPRFHAASIHPRILIPILIAILAYWVLRNLAS